MSVPFTNTTATRGVKTDTVTSNSVTATRWINSTDPIPGFFEQTTPGDVFESYGVNVKKAARFFCNPGACAAVVGDRLTMADGSEWYVQAKQPMISGLSIDHDLFILGDVWLDS